MTDLPIQNPTSCLTLLGLPRSAQAPAGGRVRRITSGLFGALALALCLLAPPDLSAQTAAPGAAPTKGEVLKGADVTPDNLVDALAPPDAAPVTRGLRIERDRPAGGSAAKRTAVSLLITFLTNSSTLTTPSRQQLDTLAAALKDDRLLARKFTIEGHADPRGNERTNLILSQQRAESVRQYLINSHGVAAERLFPVGKGSAELMNSDDVTAPENRRVTIVTRPEGQ
jgi:outer membrane protein OmpA-like peptidoglycan-associated protein